MKSIYDLIEPSERVLAVFTTHVELDSNLKINSDGTGYTGDWVIRKNPGVDRIIIYKRNKNRISEENILYKGRISSIEGPLSRYLDKKRYRIHFYQLKEIGSTNEKWSAFADCGTNPVRYFNV
jgi:hypothetical protein